MSLQFLVTLLEWLQEQFIKANERHNEAVKDLGERIRALKSEQAVQEQNARLAAKLADKIDNLLSE